MNKNIKKAQKAIDTKIADRLTAGDIEEANKYIIAGINLANYINISEQNKTYVEARDQMIGDITPNELTPNDVVDLQ